MCDCLNGIVVLNSQSKLARWFEYYITFVVIWIAIFHPLDVAFLITSNPANLWSTIHTIVYFSLGLKMIMQFFTTFHDDTGSEHHKFQHIFMHYFKTGFLWDAVATFPYSLYLSPADIGMSTKNVCGSKEEIEQFTAAGLRLPLLLWIRFLFQFKGSWRKSTLFKGFLIVAAFVYSCHMAGCMFVASGLRSVKNLEQLSWLSIDGFVEFETTDFVHPNEITYIETKFGLYVNALYWAFTTISSTGFGDICPADNISRIVTIAVITYSLYMNASIAGHVYTILLQSDTEEDRVRKVSEELDRWLLHSDPDRSELKTNATSDDAKEFIFKYMSNVPRSIHFCNTVQVLLSAVEI